MKTLKVIAVVLLVVIVLGAGIYWMVYGMSNRGLEGFQDVAPSAIALRDMFDKKQITVGDKKQYSVPKGIKGNSSTKIVGDGIIGVYSIDSPIEITAVHAGLITEGASGNVTIVIAPKPRNYISSTRNGITSGSSSGSPASYYFKITEPNEHVIYRSTKKAIKYKYNIDAAGNLISCQVKNTINDKFNFNTDTGLTIDNIGKLTKDFHYKIVSKDNLVYVKEVANKDNSGTYTETQVYYASYPGLTVDGQTYYMAGDIICTNKTQIPDNVYLFRADLFTDISVEDKKVTSIKANIYAISIDIFISDQGLIRNIISGSIKPVIEKNSDFFSVGNNDIKRDTTSSGVQISVNGTQIRPEDSFKPFSNVNKMIRYTNVNQIILLTKEAPAIRSELTQKTSNLATAQAELSAASAALNNAIRSIPSVEAFQTVGTATTTTTAQVVSPIIAKINQLKELLAQKAAEFANAKAAAEAQAKKASNNAAKAIDNAKAAANAQVKAAEETIAKLQSEIASAETKLGLLSQQLKMAVSQFQDVAALTTDKSLSDDLVSIETQIEDLTKAKKSAEGKLDDLRKLLQDAQFTTDPALLGSELANARSVLNNPPAQGACPQQKACPNISALDDTIRNLTNENASLGQKNDTKEAVIKDLDGKLDIANTTIDQLKDKIANFDKALTNEERELITNQKNDAVFAKQEIESKLKLTEYERDKAMKSRDEYRTKYETCADDLRNTFAGTATPVNAGTMMGGMPPSYVCKAMPANSGWVSPDRYAMPVPPDRYPPFNPEPEMPAPEVADRLTTGGGNFVGMVGTGVSGTQQGTEQQKQQAAASTAGIADTNLTAQTGFTDIPKQAINQQIQNTKSNHYWTYRPENYDSHDRYSAPSTWWVTGYNS